MSLLSTINTVQDIVGLPRSSGVISSTDPNVRRLLALSNIEGETLARRPADGWQALVNEKTFTATATEEQSGAIPSDLDKFIVESFFNRTQKRRLVGPLSAEEWQYQEGLTAQILTDAFRIRGNAFLITPTAVAGDIYAYEFVSKNWCQDTGGTGQQAWAADSDTGILDEKLMKLGLIWRWKQQNGLDYSEDFSAYEREVTQAIMRDGSRRTMNYSVDESLLDNARYPTVPEGSWAL